METANPFLLTYSLHLIVLGWIIWVFVEKYFPKHFKKIQLVFGLCSIYFLYYHIQKIIESETTNRIISNTKISVFYLILFCVTLLYLWKKNAKNQFLISGLWVILCFLVLLYFLAFQLTGVGFNESIPFHLKTGIKGAGIGDFYPLMIDFTLGLLLIIASILVYHRYIKKTAQIKIQNKNSLFPYVIGLAILANPLSYDFYQTFKSVEEKPEFQFKNFYKKPDISSLHSDKKYNLVWIFAEAFEDIYLDQKVFPNLTPNLQKIQNHALNFTQINQVWGTGWTIAGIVGAQCGIPLYTVGRQNNDLNKLPKFLPNVVSMGNILQNDGYQNIFIQGSPGKFAGNDTYLKTHGFQLYSFENIDEKFKDKKNVSRWGLNDDQTFAFAQEQYKNLKKRSVPFSIMVSTINTHSPRGFIPPKYQHIKYGDGKNITLNAFHVSDQIIHKFISEIKKMDTENNTIIVVSSDHLTMRNLASTTLDKHAEKRKNLFMVYFPEEFLPKNVDKIGSTLDEGVTVLQLMGYPIENLGLGKNLLGTAPTLYEKAGKETDNILKSWKKHYFQFWE